MNGPADWAALQQQLAQERQQNTINLFLKMKQMGLDQKRTDREWENMLGQQDVTNQYNQERLAVDKTQAEAQRAYYERPPAEPRPAATPASIQEAQAAVDAGLFPTKGHYFASKLPKEKPDKPSLQESPWYQRQSMVGDSISQLTSKLSKVDADEAKVLTTIETLKMKSADEGKSDEERAQAAADKLKYQQSLKSVRDKRKKIESALQVMKSAKVKGNKLSDSDWGIVEPIYKNMDGYVRGDEQAVDPMEGKTATGPNGTKIIRRNGQWVQIK